jgi:hypothetical protein
MKTFAVEIKETLARTIMVPAVNEEAAIDVVKQNWEDGTFVLTAEDFVDVDYIIIKRD